MGAWWPPDGCRDFLRAAPGWMGGEEERADQIEGKGCEGGEEEGASGRDGGMAVERQCVRR